MGSRGLVPQDQDGSRDSWQEIASAPDDRDIELSVIDEKGTHKVAFPCRRTTAGWKNSLTGKELHQLMPSHWRDWRGSL